MNRFFFFIWGTLFWIVSPQSLKAQPSNPPNILLLYADDLGYGDLSCYGNTKIRTPNLDKMAAEGMRFTDFYAPAPICSPSRAGLLTGKYPIQLGIQQVFFPESWTGLPPSETLIPEALKKAGYRSALIGKWHLGHHPQYLPVAQGFNYFFGVPYSNDMAGLVYLRNQEALPDKVEQPFTTQRFTEEASRFIRQQPQAPFFLMLAYTMPHVPLYASPAFKGKSKGGLYGDVVEELDASVGTLVRLIDSLGLAENTLILFTSDNGPWLSFGPDAGTAAPLRSGKQFTFDGGMRVPLIARWKGKVKPGTVNPSVSSQIDFFPTFLDLAGLKPKPEMRLRGASMQSQLLQNSKETERSMAYFSQGKLEAYRLGDWKLKLPQAEVKEAWFRTAMPAHDTLLFNIRQDPAESQNLFGSQKIKARQILDAMQTFQSNLGLLPPLIETLRPADNTHRERKDRGWRE